MPGPLLTLLLPQVASISCSLNKPVQETLDVTVEVAPR
jgi:hypothetical protein